MTLIKINVKHGIIYQYFKLVSKILGEKEYNQRKLLNISTVNELISISKLPFCVYGLKEKKAQNS